MATQAQILANRANAQKSTGPKSEAGKQRSARNATTHGFHAPFEKTAEFLQFEANLAASIQPQGAVEQDAFLQLLDAAWRLRAIRAITRRMYDQCRIDPIINPQFEAELRQLTRYRATAEKAFFHLIHLIGELQTTRLAHQLLLLESERPNFPPRSDPRPITRRLPNIADRQARFDIQAILQNCQIQPNSTQYPSSACAP